MPSTDPLCPGPASGRQAADAAGRPRVRAAAPRPGPGGGRDRSGELEGQLTLPGCGVDDPEPGAEAAGGPVTEAGGGTGGGAVDPTGPPAGLGRAAERLGRGAAGDGDDADGPPGDRGIEGSRRRHPAAATRGRRHRTAWAGMPAHVVGDEGWRRSVTRPGVIRVVE